MSARRFLSALLLVACLPVPARAATFQLFHRDGITVIVMRGEMVVGDGAAFARLVGRGRRTVVALESPGGSVVAGLQMGTVMRQRHLASFVPHDGMCASACALAWLGGEPRALVDGGRVGFHAAFNEINGQKVESGIANALVGAYLNGLGLSMEAVAYVEMAHPDGITWLTREDAQLIGLRVRFVPAPPITGPAEPDVEPDAGPEPSRPPSPRAAPRTVPPGLPGELVAPDAPSDAPPAVAQTAENRARGFVQDFFARWSESDEAALTFFGSAYADSVSFYGKQSTAASVLLGKKEFAQRWPVRVYGASPDGMRVFCEPATGLCTVGGIVNWDCRNPERGAHSAGSASFSFTVRNGTDGERIVGETGTVLSRQAN